VTYIRRLEWDEWNREHVAKHRVTPAEVEEVCHGNPFELRASYKDRFVVVGVTENGRCLSVIIGPTPDQPSGSFYVFSARPSARKEQQAYEAYLKESAND